MSSHVEADTGTRLSELAYENALYAAGVQLLITLVTGAMSYVIVRRTPAYDRQHAARPPLKDDHSPMILHLFFSCFFIHFCLSFSHSLFASPLFPFPFFPSLVFHACSYQQLRALYGSIMTSPLYFGFVVAILALSQMLATGLLLYHNRIWYVYISEGPKKKRKVIVDVFNPFLLLCCRFWKDDHPPVLVNGTGDD
jgi:hypothetical protein